MKKYLLASFLVLAPVAASAQFCPSCIQNTAAPENAQMNITSATIRTTLLVSTETVTNLYVTNFTTTNLFGNGAGITALNASSLASGTVPSARVSGSYTGITSVGVIAGGLWQGSTVQTQYGGTRDEFGSLSSGRIISFSDVRQMSPLLPPTPPRHVP